MIRKAARRFNRIGVPLLVAGAFTASAVAGPVAEKGRLLDTFFTGLQVETYWIAGEKIHWKSGRAVADQSSSKNRHSHCSAFAAAAAFRLGVYLLRPPEHQQRFLADAQYDWLRHHGCGEGWFAVGSESDAQELANDGFLVAVIYREPGPDKRGHVAIVRPADKAPGQIDLEGPDIIQAGKKNYSRTTLVNGFKLTDNARKRKSILFFGHFLSRDVLVKSREAEEAGRE